MGVERDGFGFSVEEKLAVRERAGGMCEHDDCDRPIASKKVHHLEAVFIAKLDGKTKESISDPNMNALQLCEPHEYDLDDQQQYQIDCLLFERKRPRLLPNPFLAGDFTWLNGKGMI